MSHFAAVCRSKLVNEVQRDTGVVAKGSSVDHWFLGALSGDSLEDTTWRVQLKVQRLASSFQDRHGCRYNCDVQVYF